MKPTYQINLGSADITGNFNDRMMSCTVVEKAGNGEFSTLDMELDDRDSALAVPPKGEKLEIFLGYQETGIGSVGVFTIDQVDLVWEPARKMLIRGHSADLKGGGLKAHRNENYENKTLADVANAIGGRTGLEVIVMGTVGQTSLGAMLHQNDESDMNLLTRLARDHNAIFTVGGGKLVIAPQGTPLAGMTLTVIPAMVSKCRVKLPDRSHFDTTTAYAFDFKKGKRVAVDGGGGAGLSSFNLKQLFWDASVAATAAQARKSELDRAKAEAHCELAYGNPNIGASGNLVLDDFRDGMDGTYTITQVEHNFDSQAYVTKVDGENQEDSGPEAKGTDDQGDNEE